MWLPGICARMGTHRCPDRHTRAPTQGRPYGQISDIIRTSDIMLVYDHRKRYAAIQRDV
jgi:hypothetical protein